MLKGALSALAERAAIDVKSARAKLGLVEPPNLAPSETPWRRHLMLAAKFAAGLLVLGVIFMLGAAAGVVAQQNEVPDRLARRFDFEQRIAAVTTSLGIDGGDIQRATWRPVVLNQHTMEWASIRVYPSGARGGAIAEAGGFIIFSSPLGRFGYLSPDNRLEPLPLRAPTNVAAIRDSALRDNPLFMATEFRVHDLATRQTGPQSWELYATLSRFAGENCYQFKVVRTDLDLRAGELSARSAQWSDVFTARPGCIPNKDRGWLFQGTEAGGRMVFTGEHTMLVSVGDHQFDGFNSHQRAANDPAWDLGKLIEINLETGTSRIYAQGMRNPQGLVVMRDGRIFSTEHGPQGGDEINFVREGANYGWPNVSYGMNYGFPRSNWPGDPEPGGHAGFARPALAFVPSIGISNLAQPSAEEFPYWSDDDLLLLSLRAGTLFHVRVFEDRVAFVEPVEFNRRVLGRERLRDIITLADGRNVILTDSGRLIFLRNAERHPDEESMVVAGYSQLSRPLPEEMFVTSASRAERGRQYFEIGCASCHSLDGRNGIGPSLNGVVGRRIGGSPGFAYSEALSSQHDAWSVNRLRAFITDPQHAMPGTVMPAPDISWTMAPEIVDFLQIVRESAPRREAQQ
ncbi:MAG: PQQ-dependent sugar dehydrogenase [Hyphomonadaceae bacterium]